MPYIILETIFKTSTQNFAKYINHEMNYFIGLNHFSMSQNRYHVLYTIFTLKYDE